MNDETPITTTDTTEKPTRKRYGVLPDDSPRNKLGRKTRPKVLTKAVLIYMTPREHYDIKRNAEKAGFPSYSSYMRFAGSKIINEDSLIINIPKRTMRNLQQNAEDAGKAVDEYVKFLLSLKVQVG